MFNRKTNFRDSAIAGAGSVVTYLLAPEVGLTRPEQVLLLIAVWVIIYLGLQDISARMRRIREARNRIQISRLRIEQERRYRKVINFPARRKSLWFVQVDENGTEVLEWM